MVGTSNLSVPDMAIDIMEDSWDNYGILGGMLVGILVGSKN
jgi:hypothetical protein